MDFGKMFCCKNTHTLDWSKEGLLLQNCALLLFFLLKKQHKILNSVLSSLATFFWCKMCLIYDAKFPFRHILCKKQRYTYRVLQTIQMQLVLLSVWAERAVLGSAKTALKFKREI